MIRILVFAIVAAAVTVVASQQDKYSFEREGQAACYGIGPLSVVQTPRGFDVRRDDGFLLTSMHLRADADAVVDVAKEYKFFCQIGAGDTARFTYLK